MIGEGFEPGRHLGRRRLGGEKKKLEVGRVVPRGGSSGSVAGAWEKSARPRNRREGVSRGRKLALQAEGSVETGGGILLVKR